jgi:hypothetical protein
VTCAEQGDGFVVRFTHLGSPILGHVVSVTQYDTAGNVLGTTSSPLLAATLRSYAMPLPAAGWYRFTAVATNVVGPARRPPSRTS